MNYQYLNIDLLHPICSMEIYRVIMWFLGKYLNFEVGA